MIKEVLQQLEPLDAQIDALCSSTDDAEMANTTTHAAELAELSAQENMLLQRCTSLTPEDRVFLARRPDRPHIGEIIDNLFTDFFEQCGDRQCKEDAAILCGIARFHGMPVTVLGHRKGTTLEENLRCNFGMPGPEGYRKALRVMKQAEKFRRPIITFIDTPGHEAFTAMRARGAKVTDIAILVVAADDGIMPQTVEAINHIKAAKVPMIVAINKMDKPGANPERVKQQLTEYDVVPEEWGGDTICVPISAINGTGIDKLLDTILLVAEVSELKANPKNPASGYVLESRVDKGRGVEVTVVVRDGTLKVGDFVISGTSYGKVKAMNDYKGNSVKTAGPSMAVSLLGFNNVPEAGEKVYVVDEKMGKNIVDERVARQQVEMITKTNNVTLEEFLKQSADNEVKTLNLIVKADVKGSAEALKASLEKIHNDEVNVKVIHSTAGAVNESDVLLAQTSGAIIIAFNVRPDSKAKVLAERNGVDIKAYRVIYDAIDDVTKAINGMLTPKFEEKILGHAEVRHIFKISSVGTIAGSYVQDGTVNRGNKIRLLRSNVVIAETEIESLQQGKDDAKTVKAGFECGIKLKNYSDIKDGDIIEAYEVQQI